MFDFDHPCFLIENKYRFTIISLEVQQFGYNSLYEFELLIFSTTAIRPQALLESSSLYLCDRNNKQLPVDIHAIEYSDDGSQHFQLTAKSPLYRLKEIKRKRIFSQQPIKPLLKVLLAKHNINNVCIQCAEQTIDFMMQHQQSDLHLFYEIIVNYSLRFFFDVERQQWVIQDHSHAALNQTAPSTKILELKHNNKMGAKLQTIYCSLPTEVVLQSYQNLQLDKHSVSTQSISDKETSSIHLTFNQVIADSQQLLQRARALLAQLDCLRELTVIDSSNVLTSVGQVLTVRQENQSRTYTVIALTGQWQDFSHNAGIKHGSNNHWRYFLIPYRTPYLPFNCLLYPRSFVDHLRDLLSDAVTSFGHWPHTILCPLTPLLPPPLINATVSRRTGMQTYKLCFPDHNHETAKDIMAMSPLGKQQEKDSRVLLPFSDNSQVVVAFLNNSYYLPMIIGQISKSTSMDYLVKLKTPQSLELVMTNKEIKLSQNTSHQLLLTNDKQRESLHINADKRYVTFYAKESLKLITEQTLSFNGKAINLTLSNQLTINTERVSINAKRNVEIKTHSCYTYADSLHIETQKLESQAANCSLQSGKQLSINSKAMHISGELTIQAQRIRIKTASAHLQLDSNGLSFAPGLTVTAAIIQLSGGSVWLNPH